MAKVAGPLQSQMAWGTFGNLVFYGGKAGPLLRRRSFRKRKFVAGQKIWASRFGIGFEAWRIMPQLVEDLAKHSSYMAITKKPGPGTQIRLSGIQLFMRWWVKWYRWSPEYRAKHAEDFFFYEEPFYNGLDVCDTNHQAATLHLLFQFCDHRPTLDAFHDALYEETFYWKKNYYDPEDY